MAKKQTSASAKTAGERRRRKLDEAALKRFCEAVYEFVRSQVPRRPDRRNIEGQKLQQASDASGISKRNLAAYRNGERAELPDGDTLRRFCAAARPSAPSDLAGEILYGDKPPQAGLADMVAAYCETQLRTDPLWDDLVPDGINGEAALALLVEELRKAANLRLLLGPVFRELEHADMTRDEQMALMVAYSNLTQTPEQIRARNAFTKRA